MFNDEKQWIRKIIGKRNVTSGIALFYLFCNWKWNWPKREVRSKTGEQRRYAGEWDLWWLSILWVNFVGSYIFFLLLCYYFLELAWWFVFFFLDEYACISFWETGRAHTQGKRFADMPLRRTNVVYRCLGVSNCSIWKKGKVHSSLDTVPSDNRKQCINHL